ncbi:MAG TPA: hypothetical protein VGK06_08175 [Methanosarcina sp.]
MINDAQTEQTKNISEGIKSQIGTTLKNRANSSADGSQLRGIKSRVYYLDVIFVQIILLLLLYGISVVVVHTFK